MLATRIPISDDERRHRRNDERLSFTIIELLVVIAIIMILAALLMPVASQVRVRAKGTSCMNQLRQFGMATQTYRDDNDKRMPPWLSSLSPDYIPGVALFVCPQDDSAGYDGGRSGGISTGGHPDKVQVPSNWEPGVEFDRYQETDDTERNTNTLNHHLGWSRSDFDKSMANPDVNDCSYMYEFAYVSCTWFPDCNSAQPAVPMEDTWYSVKEAQLKNGLGKDANGFCVPYSSWSIELFPTIRCFHHYDKMWRSREMVFNTAYSGAFVKTKSHWEDGIYQ